MDQFQRAAQLWPVLVFAARHQKILSYTTAMHLTGLAKPAIGPIALGPIARYCMEHKLPWLTALMVSEETGLPGLRFMKAVKREFGDPPDIFRLQSRVFVYDWFKHPVPTPDDFKSATIKHRESTGEEEESTAEELEAVT
jgi:hypothetical protein